MDWLITGPLIFRNSLNLPVGAYLAGDALGFVDPFTGSGILAALVTGNLAGRAAAQRLDPGEHLRNCRKALEFQYLAAGVCRRVLEAGWAQSLAPLVPGRVLFSLTRPRLPA